MDRGYIMCLLEQIIKRGEDNGVIQVGIIELDARTFGSMRIEVRALFYQVMKFHFPIDPWINNCTWATLDF